MKILIDFYLCRKERLNPDGTPKSEHLERWMEKHRNKLLTNMPVIPDKGDTVRIETENDRIILCQVTHRTLIASAKRSRQDTHAVINVEIVCPELIKESLFTDEDVILETRDLLSKDIMPDLKNGGAAATRLRNALAAADIRTYSDVCQYKRAELEKFRNIGRQATDYLETLLHKKGLKLGMDPKVYGLESTRKI